MEAWLDRVVEPEGVIKCITVRHLIFGSFKSPTVGHSIAECGLGKSPNCLRWVRNLARSVVGSRWHENQRQIRSRDATTKTGQPKLRNSGMGLVELAPPTKSARSSAGDSLYPRIVPTARNGGGAKPVWIGRNNPHQARFTQAKGKLR